MDIQRDENGVIVERSGWRDEKLSRRHRTWGRDIAVTNLDFIASPETMIDEETNSVFAEIWYRRPVLITDYKSMKPTAVDWDTAALGCLQFMANQCKCAITVVFYSPNYWWFYVVPGNEIADRLYKGGGYLTEFQYVLSLYQLRGIAMPSHIARNLCKELPKRGD